MQSVSQHGSKERGNVICVQSNDHTDVLLRPCSDTCDDNAVRKSCIPAKEEAQHMHIGDRQRHAALVFLLMARTGVLAAVALAAVALAAVALAAVALAAVALAAVALAAVALAAVVHLPAQGGLWKQH